MTAPDTIDAGRARYAAGFYKAGAFFTIPNAGGTVDVRRDKQTLRKNSLVARGN
jgi:hypothetical protein